MARTDCRDLEPVDNNKTDEHYEYLLPNNPRSDQESWTDVALIILLGLVVIAFAIVLSLLHFAYFVYMMRRQGADLW